MAMSTAWAARLLKPMAAAMKRRFMRELLIVTGTAGRQQRISILASGEFADKALRLPIAWRINRSIQAEFYCHKGSVHAIKAVNNAFMAVSR
jgi:hypothetical protein